MEAVIIIIRYYIIGLKDLRPILRNEDSLERLIVQGRVEGQQSPVTGKIG